MNILHLRRILRVGLFAGARQSLCLPFQLTVEPTPFSRLQRRSSLLYTGEQAANRNRGQRVERADTSSRELTLARTANPSNAVVEAETPSSLLVALKVALSSSGRQSRRREERTGLPPRTSSSDGKQHCVAACLLGTPSSNSVSTCTTALTSAGVRRVAVAALLFPLSLPLLLATAANFSHGCHSLFML